MKLFFSKKFQQASSSAFVFLLVAGVFAIPPIRSKAQPVAVAIAAVVFVTTAAVAACQLNLFGICPPPASTGGSKGGTKGGTTVTPADNNNNPDSQNSGTQNGNGNSPVGAICTSAPNAVCGITSQGVIVGGVCNAATPANSACPSPIVPNSGGFYADPNLVRSGSTSNLHWSVTNATACAVTGGGLQLDNLGITGSTITGAVNSKTVYTLTCVNGTGGPATSVNATVNLIPNTQEL